MKHGLGLYTNDAQTRHLYCYQYHYLCGDKMKNIRIDSADIQLVLLIGVTIGFFAQILFIRTIFHCLIIALELVGIILSLVAIGD
jgi:hypothetical protein